MLFLCFNLVNLCSACVCVQMCFKYVAEQLELVESFWSFVIETLALSLPFLCVGSTREPHVYLSRPHILLGELLVGMCGTHSDIPLLWLHDSMWGLLYS